MQDELYTLKASDSVNWGFTLFGGISVTLGYWLAHGSSPTIGILFYLLAGVFGLSATLSPLFFQYRTTVLTSERLEVSQGTLSKKNISISIKDIKKINVVYIENGQKKAEFLEDLDFSKVKNIKIDEINFTCKGEKFSFHGYNYDNEPFNEFVETLKKQHQRAIGTTNKAKQPKLPKAQEEELVKEEILEGGERDEEGEQISGTIQKTRNYLNEDLHLRQELLEAMNEAYYSVYLSNILKVVREGDHWRLKKEDVAFYYTKDEINYQFYLKGNYKAEAGEIEIAEKLIATSLHNVGIVEARIKVYEEIMMQLQKTQAKYLQRAKLQSLANKISNLQQRNIQNSEDKDELAFDSSLIVDLDKLTEKLKKADLEHYAETLIQHANLLKNNDINEQETILLKDLNNKIK